MYRTLSEKQIQERWQAAQEAYALVGVDAAKAVEAAAAVPLSLHCWQGDDVAGFENATDGLTGGIMATGNHPGRARTPQELRSDLATAATLIPGVKKVNVHALYAETGGQKVDRDALGPEHFAHWISWAQEHRFGLDFNPSYFSHPRALEATLSHPDPATRKFWVRHGIQSRKIASAMGQATGMPAVNNVWIPDGSKDYPADRLAPRLRLKEALDEVFADKADPRVLIDAVESKLFGIGSEAYVVGSHEFYTAYAVSRALTLCLDMGHFHPTETIADKISALLPYVPGLLLHVSRGMRWDSDHVVVANDDVQAVFHEIQRSQSWNRVSVALDFFDASINRVMAWTIGARATRKTMLAALLEPTQMLRDDEKAGRLGSRLALMEELKSFPVGAVWDYLCLTQDVPVGLDWLNASNRYEADVLSKRQ